MEKTTKILLMVIIGMSVGEAMEDMVDIAKELRIEMGEMKNDLKAKSVLIQELEREISATKEDLLTTMEDLKTKDVAIKYLESQVSNLRDAPFTFACGAHSAAITSATISYSTLLYSSTNVEGSHGLDILTGVFTAGYPGTYTATWGLAALDNAGDSPVNIYLRKNGERIQESRHLSHYTGSTGRVSDQGGRTLVLHLGRGDTLDLYCSPCSHNIYQTTFCVSLSKFDVE